MKLTRCSNGHYYDEEKYSSCPHCNPAGGDGGTVPFSGNNDMYNGFNGGGGDAVTNSFFSTSGMSSAAQGNYTGYDGTAQTAPLNINPFPIPNQDDDEGHTIGIRNIYMPGNDAGAAESPVQFSPVVGWLVCIEGSNIGKSFELKAGKNFIGRGHAMNIVLDGDRAVSRERHAIIVYDPMNRVFYAQPGDSHELFYVNDNVVLSSMKLFDRDRILIGKTKLVFIPFCNPTFGWDDVTE